MSAISFLRLLDDSEPSLEANLSSNVIERVTAEEMEATMSWKRSVILQVSIVWLAAMTVCAGCGIALAQGTAADNPSGMGARAGTWLPGARGVLGKVVSADASTVTIKLDSGIAYTIHFDANTRILQQPSRQKQHGQSAGPRPHMQQIAASDLHPGDAITAVGEVDDTARTVGAVAIVRLDPARAARLKTLETNYGKTWLAGSITSIQGAQVTILGMVDRAPHVVLVDKNTRFRRMRDAIALADLKPGDVIHIAGAAASGNFTAATIRVMPSHLRRDIKRSNLAIPAGSAETGSAQTGSAQHAASSQ